MTQENKSPHQGRNPHHMQAHVKAFQQSGLSRAAYCRQHNLSYHALTYWCNKEGSRQCSPSQVNLVPVPLHRSHPLSAKDTRFSLRLCLQQGIAIEIGDQFSSDTLLRLLSVLEQRK